MIPLDVAPLVDEFNVGPLAITRRNAPGINRYGEREDATADMSPTSLTPVAVYPPTGKQLEQVPDADRHRETIALATKVRLYVAADGKVADVIAYQGRTYRVVNVGDYEQQGGVFTALAVLEDA